MTEFENLKNSYIAAIQFGMADGLSFEDEKRGNEILLHFCKLLIRSSSYQSLEKGRMEIEIDALKQLMDAEIEIDYKK